MPPRKKIDLPDHVRDAVLADVKMDYEQAINADERSKIRIYLATEQGLSTYELAEELSVSQSVISNWKRQGEEAYKRREQARDQQLGEDPLRPGELFAHG
ncbi:transposase [Streptomyces himalayensis]|uniref:Uncharacterized protein n=1 Tax=Streptomyces himalayensis subsp. himalayensis TaxID=2756131 RepID=A0A7W0IDM3_9ACTN|nr:transposase [Streptomyces himalayensis]MBA2951409.1 hypothetical protein [Streptomyces himalayensis subsp. himalayensis]